MMALRTARAFTGRSRIARFEGHYHGQHDAALVSVAHVAGPDGDPQPVADGAGIPAGVIDDVSRPAVERHRRGRAARSGADATSRP